jgi:hypothetical protein
MSSLAALIAVIAMVWLRILLGAGTDMSAMDMILEPSLEVTAVRCGRRKASKISGSVAVDLGSHRADEPSER